MNVYYINLLLILGLAYPLCIRNPNRVKKICYLLITFGFMWFVATFRHGIGFDFYSYLEIFEEIRSVPDWKSVFALKYEPGFELVTRLMGYMVNTSVGVYGIYSLLIFAPIAVSIYLYCDDVWLSTWLYVMLTYFYSSMSFMRQNLACGVALLGYKFLRDRKPIPYFLIVLVAASFHKTALVMIPLYFLSMIPINVKTMVAYGVAIITGYLLSPWIVDFVTDYVFTYYKGSMYLDPEQASHPIFLLIPSVLLILCLSVFPIWKQRDPRNANMLTNMMVFSWGIWLMITHHFIIERLSHYPYMLMLIGIPAGLRVLYAPQEDYDKLATIEHAVLSKKGKAPKSEMAEAKRLRQKISDHQKYYWSATGALLLITVLYHEFGQYVNNFHHVFPYQSVLSWLR